MSRLPIEIKEKAIRLRRKGYSLNEIVNLLGMAKSTASLWAREIIISDKARKRLLGKIKLGQYISAEKKKADTAKIRNDFLLQAEAELGKIKLDVTSGRLLCAIMYWCEGLKKDGGVGFTNSDPKLTRKFIDLLIKHFGAERKRFKARLHLHSYHIPKKQLNFWQKQLGLPINNFYRPYLKPNSGKRLRDNYPGCVALSYNDTMLARRLLSYAKAFLI